MISKVISRHFQQNTVQVPEDLEAITRRDPNAVSASEVGIGQGKIENIWQQMEGMYQTGYHPGLSLCIRHQGQMLMNRSLGHASGHGPGDTGPAKVLELDTPISLFSSSKALTAILILKLVEEGSLSLQDPVCEHIPEFAAHGKHRTTIEQVLAHQAGIPSFPAEFGIEHAGDWDDIIQILCEMPPISKAGSMTAYHAITGGYILGEVAQRATGDSLQQLLDRILRIPLGIEQLSYGVPEAMNDKVALNYFTGPPLPLPVAYMARKALGIDFDEACELSNQPIFMNSVVPAGNIYTSAESCSRIFQMLVDGGRWQGEQVLSEDTVRLMAAPFGRIRYDRLLRLPMRYSRGFMLGHPVVSLYGARTPLAFGHLGFINILCWADPQRDISVSLLTTGKAAVGPHLPALAKVLNAINTTFKQKSPGEMPAWAADLPRGLAAAW